MTTETHTEYRRRSSSRSRSPRGRRNTSSDRNRLSDDDYYRRGRPSSSDKRASSHHRSSKPEKPKESEEERLTEAEKEKLRQTSKRECRVYVGNLAYSTRSSDLKRFLSDAGTIVYADVLTNPNGFSKGCGIVEFSTAEGAKKAIADYSEKSFMGRPIFVREDREEEATIGLNKSSGKQVFVANLPYTIGWQDLKDFFRNAGNVVRADVMMFPDRQSKGVGTVSFETTEDVQNAISMYDGYEWQGRKLEVREDKFPQQGSGGFPSRNPQRFSPYARPMVGGRYGAPPYYGSGGYGHGPYDGGYRDAYGGGGGHRGYYGEPYYGEGYGMMRGGPPRGGRNSESAGLQIYVGNLPYSTTMQDLKDLFRSCGNIAYAEALMLPTGKPKGCGIVKFDAFESVERACAKFHGYVYGGRPLEVRPDRYT